MTAPGGLAPPFILKAIGVSFDSDAQAYINAVATLTAAQQTAINDLVVQLKEDGIYTKMHAIYPVLGGTASAHKFNLINPVDTDAGFRLTFTGGITHASTGMLGNGTNGFADAHYIPSADAVSQNDGHISYYSQDDVNLTQVELGCDDAGSDYLMEIRTSGTSHMRINNNALTTFADADSLGFYIVSRVASDDIKCNKNGVEVMDETTASEVLPTTEVYLLAWNDEPAIFFSTKECAFASIGEGLTPAEMVLFNTAVATYQTTLGRAAV